ncbi:hypothetical protein [Antribacter gilvus]|uniref:hypothetical protein n=1 Tax=Antribacter gilvus TaxID=2304675 RepID=UPI000F7A3CC1|nr:hypothetical protein [Antribacter gilvus]
MSDTNAAGPAPEPQQPATPEPSAPEASPQPQQPQAQAQPEPPARPQPMYGAYAPQTDEPGQPGQSGMPAYGAPGAYASPYGPPSAPQTPDWNRMSQPAGPVRVGEAVGYGFSAFGRNAGIWLVVTFLVAVAAFLITLLTTPALGDLFRVLTDPVLLADPAAMEAAAAGVEEVTFVGQLLTMVGSVVASIIGFVLYQGALVQTRDGSASFGAFFTISNWGGVATFAVLQALVNLVALVPGVGWLLQLLISFFFLAAPYYVLDQGQDGLTAIRSSVRLVSSNVGVAILAFLVVIGLSIAGALACGIGLLVVVPVLVLMGGYLYRRLEGQQVVVS